MLTLTLQLGTDYATSLYGMMMGYFGVVMGYATSLIGYGDGLISGLLTSLASGLTVSI